MYNKSDGEMCNVVATNRPTYASRPGRTGRSFHNSDEKDNARWVSEFNKPHWTRGRNKRPGRCQFRRSNARKVVAIPPSHTPPGQGNSTGPAKETEGQAINSHKHGSSKDIESGTGQENAIDLTKDNGTDNQAGAGHNENSALIQKIRDSFVASQAAYDEKAAQRKKAAQGTDIVDPSTKQGSSNENSTDEEETVKRDLDDAVRE